MYSIYCIYYIEQIYYNLLHFCRILIKNKGYKQLYWHFKLLRVKEQNEIIGTLYSQHFEDNKVRTITCVTSLISETPDTGLVIIELCVQCLAEEPG